MTSVLGLKLQEAIEQAEARKAMANWNEPTPMTTPISMSEAIFNAVRDNPGQTKMQIAEMLAKQGYKHPSTMSMASAMVRYGILVQENKTLLAVGAVYKTRLEFNGGRAQKRGRKVTKKEVRMIIRPRPEWTPPVADVPDAVNHPAHYKVGGIETIDFIKAKLTQEQLKGYYLGNLLKYLSRAEYKNGGEDFKKAQVYLQWLTELEDRETSPTSVKPSGG